jgi:hypothetical protein
MARPGYSLGISSGVKSLLLTLAHIGPLVAFSAMTLKVRMPESGVIVGVTFNVAAKGGTHSNSALAVQNAGNVVATIDVDAAVAGTPSDVEGSSLANTTIVKDAVLSFVTTESGGTSPTWQGATVQVDYVRSGD